MVAVCDDVETAESVWCARELPELQADVTHIAHWLQVQDREDLFQDLSLALLCAWRKAHGRIRDWVHYRRCVIRIRVRALWRKLCTLPRCLDEACEARIVPWAKGVWGALEDEGLDVEAKLAEIRAMLTGAQWEVFMRVLHERCAIKEFAREKGCQPSEVRARREAVLAQGRKLGEAHTPLRT